MKLYYLIYISKANQPMQSDELSQLLNECRTNNEPKQLTGMLLYLQSQPDMQFEGRFMQVLEGAKEEVRGIFEKIRNDERHRHIMVINEGPISKRNFKNWTMGFETLDLDGFRSKPGHFELTDEFLQSRRNQQFNLPLNYLKSFYMMRLGNAG
jgi:hypothetical protein